MVELNQGSRLPNEGQQWIGRWIRSGNRRSLLELLTTTAGAEIALMVALLVIAYDCAYYDHRYHRFFLQCHKRVVAIVVSLGMDRLLLPFCIIRATGHHTQVPGASQEQVQSAVGNLAAVGRVDGMALYVHKSRLLRMTRMATRRMKRMTRDIRPAAHSGFSMNVVFLQR